MRLRLAYLVMSLLLLVQFALGMVVNLFVSIPKHHPGVEPSNYFAGSAQSIGWAIPRGGVWLAAHASLGLALVLCGIVVLVLGLRSGGRVVTSTAVVGAIAILGAGFNGASFLDFNEDFSSMIMASLFAVALGSYIVGLGTVQVHEAAAAASQGPDLRSRGPKQVGDSANGPTRPPGGSI